MFYYILLLIMMGLSAMASAKVQGNFREYSNVLASSGLTGVEVAKLILSRNGINDVDVQPISGTLSDHYDPRSKIIRLSEPVYGSNSVSAVSVAAHEVGHAIQDHESYGFLRFRSTLAPLVQFSSQFVMILIMVGFFLQLTGLINVGIILYSLSVLFHIVTLPVEFDASNRAMKQLVDNNIIRQDERQGTKRVLGAAALTYVASALVSVIQLLRFISMRNSRRR